jgi:hypothetical protein
MNDEQPDAGLSEEELEAQDATALPDKEVVSILDLNADINLAIDAAAPIDLAVAANANVAAPIDAAVGANVLSVDSTAQALSDQGVLIHQSLDTDATAHATQASALDQSNDGAAPVDTTAGPVGAAAAPADAAGALGETAGTAADPAATVGDGAATVGDAAGDAAGTVGTVGGATDATGGLLDGNLLNVDVNVDANADIAAPINGAVAANANVAAPIDAAVGANVGSVGSDAVAVSQQDAVINQDIEGSAEATSDQASDITQ